MEEVSPKIKLHNFSTVVYNKPVHCTVVKLDGSFLLWVGTSPPTMSTLAVAMQCPPTVTSPSSAPVTTQLIGNVDRTVDSALAHKLAKKTGKQCFVSFNVPELQEEPHVQEIEKAVFAELKEKPHVF